MVLSPNSPKFKDLPKRVYVDRLDVLRRIEQGRIGESASNKLRYFSTDTSEIPAAHLHPLTFRQTHDMVTALGQCTKAASAVKSFGVLVDFGIWKSNSFINQLQEKPRAIP